MENLLPAVSIYEVTTFNLGDNPFYPEDATISYRGIVALGRLTPKSVLIAILLTTKSLIFQSGTIPYRINAFRNPNGVCLLNIKVLW